MADKTTAGLRFRELNATFAANILGGATDFKIGANTSDGSDNAQLKIMGGGDATDVRGASIHLAGNEHGNAGLLQLRAGDGTTGGIRLYEGGSERMRISAGKVIISNTGSTGTPSGLLHIKGTGDAIRVESTNTGAGGAQIDLLHFTTSPADEDTHGMINMGGYYTGTTSVYGSQILSKWTDVSARHSRLEFKTLDTTLSTVLTLAHDKSATFGGDVRIPQGAFIAAQSSLTNPVLRLTNTDVNNYDFTFPNNSTLQLGSNVNSDLIFKLLNAGTGNFNLAVNGGVTAIGAMSSFETTLTNNDDWQNSPISILERDNVGSGQTADKYSPNLNFHWGGIVSRSLWMDANGHLHYGEYSTTGIPDDKSGHFRANEIHANIFRDKGSTGFYLDPASTGTSLNIAGAIELDDAKPIKWGTENILSHNGTQTYLGDATSASALTLSGGNATFEGDNSTNGIIRSAKNIVSNSVYNLISMHSTRGIDDYGGLGKNYMQLNLVTPGASTTGGSSAHGFGNFSLNLANSGSNSNMTEVLNITSGGAATFVGPMTISGSFSSPGDLLTLYNTNNGGGSGIRFSDQGGSNPSAQKGFFKFHHVNTASHGGGAAFDMTSTEDNLVLAVGNADATHGRIVVWGGANNQQPDYGFAQDLDTGMLRTGTNAMRFVTGGTPALDFDSSQLATFGGDTVAPGVYVGSRNVAFDFYNNGTSYFNGDVEVNAKLHISDEHLVLRSSSPEFYFATTGNNHYNWMIAAQENVDGGLEFGHSSATTSTLDLDASNYVRTLTLNSDNSAAFAGTIKPSKGIGWPTTQGMNSGGGTAYKRIGTWKAGQQGRNLYLCIVAGSGYNASYAQQGEIHILLRTSNASSTKTATQGSAVEFDGYYYQTGTVKLTDSAIRVEVSASDEYTIYMLTKNFIGIGAIKANHAHNDEFIVHADAGGSSSDFSSSNYLDIIEYYKLNTNAIFAGTVKGTTYLVNHASAAGIGASLGDINSAELGPGYLSLSRDDTADAKQIVFEKNDAEHSYLRTDDDSLRIVAGAGKNIFIDTNNNVANMWRFTSSGIFQWGAARGTLTWDSNYARVHAQGTDMELHLGSGNDNDAVKIIGSDTTFAGNITINDKITFAHNDNHFIQSGTNSWAFKANSGTAALVLTTGGAATFAGNLQADFQLLGRAFRGTNRGELHLNATGTNDVAEIFFGFGSGYTENNIRWAISDRGTSQGLLHIYQGPANGGFTPLMTFKSSNDSVGIGTTDPSELLTLNKASGAVGILLEGNGTDVGKFKVASAGVNHAVQIGSISNNEVQFHTNNSEKMRITSAGNVGINITNPGQKLTVSSDGSGTSDVVRINHGNGSHTGHGLSIRSSNSGDALHVDGTAGSGFAKITSAYNSNPSLQISGDVVAFASSDKRFKDNLEVIKNPIDKLQHLNGYTFEWNNKQDVYKGKDYGVVAQEVEKVAPELVNTRFDGYKAVKYEKLVPLLIESIKELKLEIEELKKQIK